MKRRLITMLLAVAMLISVIPATNVFAADSDPQSYTIDGVTYYNYTAYSELDANTEQYAAYRISGTSAQTRTSSEITKSDILAMCTLVDSYPCGDTTARIYSSQTLPELLYQCDTIVEISVLHETLYVQYVTTAGVEVCLAYTDAGFHDAAIYFPDTDTAIIDYGTSATQIENFRYGCGCVVSDEKIEEEMAAYQESVTDNADLSMDNANSQALAPSNSVMPLANGFTSESSMLADLKSDFPVQNGVRLSTSKLYSGYIDDYFTVAVNQTRNAYTKKSANYRNFAISTTITLISAFLGVSPGITSDILTGLGIAISAIETIQQAVTLYKSAIYTFYAARDGYVYDTITQNAYVHVVYHSSYGEFAGGYDSSGNFTWIISSAPSAYNYDTSTIANNAIDLFGKEIFANGYNSRYYPD